MTSLNCASRHFVQMLALNRQMCATSVTLSYFHVHTAINILRCFGYPREHNFGLVTEPNRLYRRLRLFPSKLQEYTPPPFSRLSTQYHIDPLLILVCFLSILHERVCDYSRVQSSVTGILRMGDMNIHITWLTHVRTGPQKNRITDGTQRLRYGGIDDQSNNPGTV